MTTNNAVNVPLSGNTGTGKFVGSSIPTFDSTIIFTTGNGIVDTSSNPFLTFNKTASAVNYISFTNNATGSSPAINAVGSDGNIILQLGGKGTGGAAVAGTGTNDNATAGFVGEFISSVIASGSAATMSSNAASNVTSISLTAGDWDVWGNITFQTLGTTPTGINGWVSSTSASAPDSSIRSGFNFLAAAGLTSVSGFTVPTLRFSLSSTTTVYLSGFLSNTSGTGTACGGIYARRIR